MPRDFSESLHELRVEQLQRLPADASIVLHGGAASSWYFTWFEQHFPGTVERHIGVEAFQQRPADLPGNVEWLPRTLGDMAPVADGSVDLVFAGQVVEHLWPGDVAGFLLESHRVLASGGILALDSPNRRVTEAIGWLHPQHTVEFSVDEIVELVTLAGFDVSDVRGVLLSYDRTTHRFLGIDDLEWPVSWHERAERGRDAPEDSFVWWLEAVRADRAPDEGALRARAQALFARFRAARLARLNTPLPVTHGWSGPTVTALAGHDGVVFHGPYVPVDGGRWRVSLPVRRDPGSIAEDGIAAWVDAASESGEKVHARRPVTAAELPVGAWTTVPLDLDLPEMTMGVEFRLFATGEAAISARLDLRLEAADDAAVRRFPPGSGEDRPEPRVRELAADLARRTMETARFRTRVLVRGR